MHATTTRGTRTDRTIVVRNGRGPGSKARFVIFVSRRARLVCEFFWGEMADDTTQEGLESLCNELGVSMKFLKTVRAIDIHGKGIGDAYVPAIREVISRRRLRELNLSSNGLGASSARALVDEVRRGWRPERINLDANQIGSEGAILWAGILPVCPSLRYLSLGQNGVGDDAALAFATSVPASFLRVLHLDDNRITDKGALSIFRSCGRLEELDIGGNALTDASAMAAAKAILEWQQLTSLAVGSPLFTVAAAGAIGESLKKTATLTALNVSNSPFGDKGAGLISAALEVNRSLRVLEASAVNVTDHGAETFLRALISNTALHAISIGDNQTVTGFASSWEKFILDAINATPVWDGSTSAARMGHSVWSHTKPLQTSVRVNFGRLMEDTSGTVAQDLNARRRFVVAAVLGRGLHARTTIKTYAQPFAEYLVSVPTALDDMSFFIGALYNHDRMHALAFTIELTAALNFLAATNKSRRPVLAQLATSYANGAQLALRACIEGLNGGDWDLDDLMESPGVWDAFEKATVLQCKVLLASPAVQEAHQIEFLGHFYHFLQWSGKIITFTNREDNDEVWQSALFLVGASCFRAVFEPVSFVMHMVFPPTAHYNGKLPKGFGSWVSDPFFVFFISWVSDVLLFALCSSLPSATEAEPPHAWKRPLAAIWVVGSLILQGQHLAHIGVFMSPSVALGRFFNDVWNALDMVTFVPAAFALVPVPAISLLEALLGPAMSPAPLPFERLVALDRLLSFSVFLMALRPLRLAYLFASLGPLVRSVVLMIRDVAAVAALHAIIAVGGAAALHTLFQGREALLAHGVSSAVAHDDASCHESLDTYARSIPGSIIHLNEITLAVDFTQLGCAFASEHGLWAWALTYLILLLDSLLLLNMMIAILNKTYDTVYEVRNLYFCHSRAQMVHRARKAPCMPSPLHLVGLPALGLWLALRGAIQHGPRVTSSLFSFRVLSDTAEESWTVFLPRRIRDVLTPRRRPTASRTAREGEARRVPTLRESLQRRELVMVFVEANLDDVEVQDRWRATMMKSLTRTRERLEEVHSLLESSRGSVPSLVGVARRAGKRPSESGPPEAEAAASTQRRSLSARVFRPRGTPRGAPT